MSRYPREIRDAKIKCIACNAPVAQTVDGRYVCVECGTSPIRAAKTATGKKRAVTDD